MRREKPSLGSLSFVIQAFRATQGYQALSRSTRENYDFGFRAAELVMGDVPMAELKPSIMQVFLDRFNDTPQRKRITRTAFLKMEKWALLRDHMPHTIMHGTEAPCDNEQNHLPWTDAQVRLAEEHARPDFSRAITLAANTGQRGSDLVKMKWSDIEEFNGQPGINVIQKKTGRELWVPFTDSLMQIMDGWERPSKEAVLHDPKLDIILTKAGRNEGSATWTRPALSQAWNWERNNNPALAPLKELGLMLHGLRGTAVDRLRRAGASRELIGDFVGMSAQMVDRYSARSDQKEKAMAALRMMQQKAEVIPFRKRDAS